MKTLKYSFSNIYNDYCQIGNSRRIVTQYKINKEKYIKDYTYQRG